MPNTLLALIQLGLTTSAVDNELKTLLSFTMKQWRVVMDLASRQGVAAIAFDGVQKLYDTYPEEMRAAKESSSDWIRWVFDCTGIMTQYEQHANQQKKIIKEVAEIWASEGISMMVFKGQANSTFYPIAKHRATGDIDCWLFGQAEKGDDIIKKYSANVSFKWYRHSKISFQGEMIENHRVLGHTKGGKKRKRMDSEFQTLTRFPAPSVLEGCGKALKPSAQFNACFLTYHGLNHFISEGLRMKQVLDWAMFLDKEQDNVDWKAFNDFCERYSLDRFAAIMNYIAVYYLGVKCFAGAMLNIDGVNIKELADKVLHSTLYDDDYLFNSGKSDWTKRWILVKNMFTRDRWKYRDVAQRNIWSQLLQDSIGFLFEKE